MCSVDYGQLSRVEWREKRGGGEKNKYLNYVK